MITTPTAMVLGAGASKPYQFPTGEALAAAVVEALDRSQSTSPLSSRLEEFVPAEEFGTFVRHFRESTRSSLDTFVQSRRDFLSLVKHAIALSLALCEREENLYPNNPEDWYRYLFDQIIPAEPETFRENRLQVITFNFDRSFERRLFLALKATFNLSIPDAASLAAHVPVLHVHGQLGLPAWCSTDESDECRHYSPTVSNQQVAACVQQIRLVHEEIADSVQLRTAQEWLRKAAKIAFLGFGFHPLNVGRLGVADFESAQAVHATGLGFTLSEAAPVKRAFARTPLAMHRIGTVARSYAKRTSFAAEQRKPRSRGARSSDVRMSALLPFRTSLSRAHHPCDNRR